jgi:hypothetical protein
MKWIKLCVAAAALVLGVAACTPPPGTTPTSTTTTTAPSGHLVVDFHDQSATVGVGCTNCAEADLLTNDGHGHDVFLRFGLQDTNQAADGGYSWFISNLYIEGTGRDAMECRYPIVQARGRANIGAGTSTSTTFRMDFDGYDTSPDLIDLPGSWDVSAGNIPTMYAESMTLDVAGTPECRPLAP